MNVFGHPPVNPILCPHCGVPTDTLSRAALWEHASGQCKPASAEPQRLCKECGAAIVFNGMWFHSDNKVRHHWAVPYAQPPEPKDAVREKLLMLMWEETSLLREDAERLADAILRHFNVEPKVGGGK